MSYRSRVATVYLLGFLIDLMNMFIASVAYSAIGHSLKASVAELAWIGNGYIMGLTLAIPLSAWLTLHLGARRLLLLSLSLFIFATLQCGLSHSLFSLLFWRAIQGAGGGLLIPVGQALTWQLYAKHERAWLSAAVMLVGLLAPALSPTLGGWLAQSFSWRWIFFASVAVALPTLLLALLWLKPQLSSAEKRPLDFAGLLAGCGGLFFTLLAMTRLGEAGTNWLTAGYVAAGAVLLIFFTRRSLRHPAPLLKLSLLADPLMAFSSLVYQFVPGVFIGVSLLAMLYLQGSGFSATQAGALMIPWAMASFAAISLTGKTFNRLGPRPLIVAGCLCQAMGILLLVHSLPMAAFTLMGAGGSLCSSAAQSSAFLSVSDSQLSDASALWNINRQLSFCFGIALLTLLFNQFTHFFSRPLAYKLTFYSAAAITLLPILLSLGFNNSAVKRLLTHPEKP